MKQKYDGNLDKNSNLAISQISMIFNIKFKDQEALFDFDSKLRESFLFFPLDLFIYF